MRSGTMRMFYAGRTASATTPPPSPISNWVDEAARTLALGYAIVWSPLDGVDERGKLFIQKDPILAHGPGALAALGFAKTSDAARGVDFGESHRGGIRLCARHELFGPR